MGKEQTVGADQIIEKARAGQILKIGFNTSAERIKKKLVFVLTSDHPRNMKPETIGNGQMSSPIPISQLAGSQWDHRKNWPRANVDVPETAKKAIGF